MNCFLGGVLLGGEIRSLLGVLSRLERLSLERVRVLSPELGLGLSLERDLRSDLVADPDLALSVLEVLDDDVDEWLVLAELERTLILDLRSEVDVDGPGLKRLSLLILSLSTSGPTFWRRTLHSRRATF